MVIENNKYFNIRKDEEKNTLVCNLLAWIVLMVLSIIRVVKVIKMCIRDRYLSLLRTTREDLEDVISKGEAGLGKKEILIKLKRIRQNINNNL